MRDEYSRCSKILNTLLFFFSSRVVVITSGIHIMLVRIANREDPDQTASSEAVWSGSAVCLGLFAWLLVFKILDQLPKHVKIQWLQFPVLLFHIIPLFWPFAVIVVCSLICLYTLEAYIANTMDPDQTAPKACADPESFVRGVQFDGVFF